MSAWLVMQTVADGERPFPIRKTATVIGREANSDIRITLPGVAPRHCIIHINRDHLRLTDLGSEWGTLHNGRHVREAILADTDRITIGPVTFRVRVTDEDLRSSGSLTEPKIETRLSPGRAGTEHHHRPARAVGSSASERPPAASQESNLL